MEQGERLTQRSEGALHAGLAIGLGGGVLGFEQSPNGLGDVLSDLQDLIGDVRLALQRLECPSERFAGGLGLVRA
ncbi:MAG: hypothetical protein AAGF92_10905 [Myxococcota bacterium]